MLKMALLDCEINEKFCSVDRGRAFALFFRPHPREFAIQGKKIANARGSAWEGGGGGWAQLGQID